MAFPFAITILLAEGDPDGLRVIERSNWNGTGLDFARPDWPAIRSRAEFLKPGVYVLYGLEGEPQLYVGEADPLLARLNQHYSGPMEFWTRAVAFVSQASQLNKAIVRSLEYRLLELAHQAKRGTIKNGNMPSEPTLSEAVRAEAAGFLRAMLPIYPLLGIQAFEVPSASALVPAGPAGVRLQIDRYGVLAFGRDDPKGFLVEVGSTCRMAEQPSTPPHLRDLRDRLVSTGVLLADRDLYRLTQDYFFSSPSSAAGVVTGRAANGRTEWKDPSGRTLKQIQATAVP